jgi:ribose transport system ATP-binding protein
MDFVLVAKQLTKTFGATVAVKEVSVAIQRRKITALLGGNGAGKSTLTRIFSGTIAPDAGQLHLDSQPVDFASYSPKAAKAHGLRLVHQEPSLCTNLSISENMLLEFGSWFRGLKWRSKAERLIQETLDAIFPQHRLRTNEEVGTLSLPERQMIEIARAAVDPNLKLLILDEPTSSLDAHRAHQLLRYLKQRVDHGLSVIFIGHRLGEILDLADECLVMRDGAMVWGGPRTATTQAGLIRWLSATGSSADELIPSASQPELLPEVPREDQPVYVQVDKRWCTGDGIGELKLRAGEIVGLAGLEGSGQQRLLRAIYRADRKLVEGVRRLGRIAFVTGDRQKEGLFPLWSTLLNMTISRHARRAPWSLVSTDEEGRWAGPWQKRFHFTASALEKPITELSGGNQQKALLSRALIDDADTILLDDPTRGVDVGVKTEFYRTLREVSTGGKLIVWHSSEDAEFLQCSRVLVFRRGRIARAISGQEANRERLVTTAFAIDAPEESRREPTRRRRSAPGWLVPLLALAAVLAAMALFNPTAVSPFGLGLLLSGAMPLVFVSLGQMFVVGRSEIDLGIGGFAGITNVISATLLVEQPIIGAAALAAGLLGYALLGWIIYVRRIPAIVATLGSSFVWIGLGYSLQPMPGGSAPEWLVAFFNLSIPLVPLPVLVILGGAIVGVFLLRSRFGVILRAFGNNEHAMHELGWPAVRFHVWTYVIGGAFGLAAGLCLTGVNTASDVNAAVSYTLLSVAAVVMGGCDLVGGRIEPIGVVLAAVTLSLLGALLGFLQLSSDYIAAVQGLILLGIVVLRTIWKRS